MLYSSLSHVVYSIQSFIRYFVGGFLCLLSITWVFEKVSIRFPYYFVIDVAIGAQKLAFGV